MLRFVGDVGAKVTPNNTMPSWTKYNKMNSMNKLKKIMSQKLFKKNV